MPKDFRLFLAGISNACEKVVRYTATLSFETFRAEKIARGCAMLRSLKSVGLPPLRYGIQTILLSGSTVSAEAMKRP
jgi:hypothetical protein